MSTKEKLDNLLKKWISRKLTVFGLFSSVLTSTDWVIVATAYISIQGVSDIIERLFKLKK